MDFSNSKPVEILLVEDNDGDIYLTRKAFQDAKIANNLHVAHDGEIAMEMLLKQGQYSDSVTPDLVLLDINLPKKDGTQVLREMKSNQQLGRIPVVVLSSSKAEHDIVKTHELQASSYIVKPIDLKKFRAAIEAIEDFWFSVVVLPSK